MQAILITIGDEILIGRTVDTNSAWMATQLNQMGIDVHEIISIRDEREHILSSLKRASQEAKLILITGGLGPTSDDITKQTLADYFECGISMNGDALNMMEEKFGKRGFKLLDKHREQAMVPDACKVLVNDMGTAPGMWFEKDDVVYVSMPGVPFEMKHIMSKHVLPMLHDKFDTPVIAHRHILTAGIPEALLSQKLEGFEEGLPEHVRLAYLPDLAKVKLRLSARGKDETSLNADIEVQASKLYEIVPKYIYGEDGDTLQSVAGELLKKNNATISTAESCTGGKIASRITSVAGSSDYFMGSIVSYSNQVKMEQLGVKKETLEKFGAVSEETVREMLGGVRSLLKTDYAIAVSGIAGPGGATEGKPVGTVYIGVEGPEGTFVKRYNYPGNRRQNIEISVVVALNILINFLKGRFAIQA